MNMAQVLQSLVFNVWSTGPHTLSITRKLGREVDMAHLDLHTRK